MPPHWSQTRRGVLKLSGATITAALIGAGQATAESASWESVASPVDATLWDVEQTARNDFAIGGGGVVIVG